MMVRIGVCLALVATMSLPLQAQQGDVVLQRVAGTVGYRAGDAQAVVPITGSVELTEAQTTVTRRRSKALVTLADSSVIALGESTDVVIRNLMQHLPTGNGATVAFADENGGTVRFHVRHPSGGRSNYTFVTPTSSISVRGTTGLLATRASGDTVVCLVCTPGDAVLRAGGKSVPLSPGRAYLVDPSGNITTSALTAAILQLFLAAGISTSATGDNPFTASPAPPATPAPNGAAPTPTPTPLAAAQAPYNGPSADIARYLLAHAKGWTIGTTFADSTPPASPGDIVCERDRWVYAAIEAALAANAHAKGGDSAVARTDIATMMDNLRKARALCVDTNTITNDKFGCETTWLRCDWLSAHVR